MSVWLYLHPSHDPSEIVGVAWPQAGPNGYAIPLDIFWKFKTINGVVPGNAIYNEEDA